MANVTLKFAEYHRGAIVLQNGAGVATEMDVDRSTDVFEKRDDALSAAGQLFLTHGAKNVRIESVVLTEDKAKEINAGRAMQLKQRQKAAGLID